MSERLDQNFLGDVDGFSEVRLNRSLKDGERKSQSERKG